MTFKKIGIFGAVAGVVLLIAAISFVRGWSGEGPAERPVTVQVPQGASLASAASRIEEAGVIESASRFRLLAR